MFWTRQILIPWRRVSLLVLVATCAQADREFTTHSLAEWTDTKPLRRLPFLPAGTSEARATGSRPAKRISAAAGISVLQMSTIYRPGVERRSNTAIFEPGGAETSKNESSGVLLPHHKQAMSDLESPRLPVSLLEGRRNAVQRTTTSMHASFAERLLPVSLDWMQAFFFSGSTPLNPAVIQSRRGRVQKGLIVEAHLPFATIQKLHNYPGGSVGTFLLDLQKAFAEAAGIPRADISILGVHEQYKRNSGGGSSEKQSRMTIVRFAILADPKASRDPQEALESLQSAVEKKDGTLGRMQSLLQNCTIHLQLTGGLAVESETTRNTQLAAMAMPICISACLTGILVWLATY